MSNRINCFDLNGNSIDNFTQWDTNQTIYIEDWNYNSTPVFHFCNPKSDVALVVKGSIEKDNRAKVDIPNVFLQEAYPIIIFVYLENDTSGKTIYVLEIPVKRKPKPHDYEYTENIDYMSWTKNAMKLLAEELKNQIIVCTDDGNGNVTLRCLLK